MTTVVPFPSRRQAQACATRARVVQAGGAMFAALGYEAATIRTIAAAGGLSTGAVFAHFDDKAALYREVFGHAPVSAEQGRRLLNALLAFVNFERRYDEDQAVPDAEVREALTSALNIIAEIMPEPFAQALARAQMEAEGRA